MNTAVGLENLPHLGPTNTMDGAMPSTESFESGVAWAPRLRGSFSRASWPVGA